MAAKPKTRKKRRQLGPQSFALEYRGTWPCDGCGRRGQRVNIKFPHTLKTLCRKCYDAIGQLFGD